MVKQIDDSGPRAHHGAKGVKNSCRRRLKAAGYLHFREILETRRATVKAA
jgi:hypothetical protein